MSEINIEAHPTPAPVADQRSFPWRSWPVLTGLLLVLLVAAYADAIKHPFVYDDIPLVVKNPAIRSLSNLPSMMGFDSDGFHVKTRWTREVTHALEFAMGGLNPALYHLTNVVLHGLVGLLIFIFFARLTRDRLAGWWAAALFLVHPINTEVVSQVAGRRGLLAALFTMIFLLVMHRYLEKRGAWRLAVGFLCLYLATFSKEVGLMAAPAFLLVVFYERLQRQREGRTLVPDSHGDSLSVSGSRDAGVPGWLSQAWQTFMERRILLSAVLLFALGLTVSLFAFSGDMPGWSGSPSFYETSGPGLALLDRARLGGLSIRLALLPMGQTVDYSYRALEVSANGLTMPILVDLAFLLAGLGLTLAGLRRRNWLGFAGAWFTIYYLPVAGIISWHEVFAERFLYLPLIGFCGAAGVGIAALARRPGFRRVVPVAAVVLLAVLATATGLRNEAWASSVNLWKSAVARFPACARAHKALADQYLDDARTDLALEHYQKAVEILPAYLDAHLGVVTVLTAQRKFQLGLDHLEEVVHRWPDDPKVLNTKGLLFESIGEKEKARQTYEEIVKRNPDFAEGYNNLGRFLVEQGDVPGAIKMYEKALEVDPAFTTALLNLEIVYKYGLKDEKKAAYYQERARASARVR